MKKIILGKANIYFGTCSWKYNSWEGIVYHGSADTMLHEYANLYSSVEVDQWFWSLGNRGAAQLPKLPDVTAYAEATPDDFLFTIKLPNSLSLTHFYAKDKAGNLISNPHFLSAQLYIDFLQTIQPLHKKTGVVMLQFEYLNKQKLVSQQQLLKQLEIFVQSVPRDVPLGIEIRNTQFLNDRYFSFLQENQLSPVFLQGYYMPPIFPVIKQFQEKLQSPIVIRLHGPDRSGIEAKTNNIWNTIVEPKDDEIEELIATLRMLSTRETDIYVNVNNHFEGSAPLTIDKISKLL